MQQILIIEDDKALGNGLCRALTNETCVAVKAENLKSVCKSFLPRKRFSWPFWM